MLETVVIVIHIVVALFMILVVLVQGGNQGGVSAAFGGGNSQGVFGASGATSFLGKLTYGAAGVFMVTSIVLTVLQGGGGKVGLSDKLQQQIEQQNQSGVPAVPDAVIPAQPENLAVPPAEPSGESEPQDTSE
jgi:preprotein translocase subunit SecG